MDTTHPRHPVKIGCQHEMCGNLADRRDPYGLCRTHRVVLFQQLNHPKRNEIKEKPGRKAAV